MAKPLTDLFSYSRDAIPVIANGNSNAIIDLTSSNDPIAEIPSKVYIEGSGQLASVDGLDKKIIDLVPEDHEGKTHYDDMAEYEKHIAQVNKELKLIGDTLSKYDLAKNDPTAYIQMFGNFLNIGVGKGASKRDLSKIGDIADSLGLGLPSIIDGEVVKLPPYLSFEDERIISTSLNVIKSLFGGSFGSRLRSNYHLLFMTMTNGDLINGLLNALTGDYFKKEFEKSRFPEIMADSKTSTVDGDNEDPRSIYLDPKSREIAYSFSDEYENLVSWVTNLISSNAALQLYNTMPSTKTDNGDKYGLTVDPYQSPSGIDGYRGPTYDRIQNKKYKSIADIQNILSESGYLTGYKTFSGFEMGTNHNWMIQLHPYESKEHGEHSCTPPLPAYVLPDFCYSESNQVESVMPGIESTGFGLLSSLGANALNKWKTKLLDGVYNRLIVNGVSEDAYSEKSLASILMGALKDLLWKKKDDGGIKTKQLNTRWFSFAEHTPVLSYDLNFGSFKTESVRLFNSSMEMFIGMNYQATMNMSILDDSYGSMTKYMSTYINSIYDPVTNSVAPYYNMAFEIILTIFRTAQQINYKFRLIGVPIEYAPRFEGSSEANEVRVDITFAIIGIIPVEESFYNQSSISVSDAWRGNESGDSTFKELDKVIGNEYDLLHANYQMPVSDMKYGDITLNLGKNMSYTRGGDGEIPKAKGESMERTGKY